MSLKKIISCRAILSGFYLHLLVTPSCQLKLVSEDTVNRVVNTGQYSICIVRASKPVQELNSIWIQKLVQHTLHNKKFDNYGILGKKANEMAGCH